MGSIVETFTGSGSGLGPNLVWREAAGFWRRDASGAGINAGVTNAIAVAENPIGVPDMYSEVTVSTTRGSETFGPAVRCNTEDTTCYLLRLADDGAMGIYYRVNSGPAIVSIGATISIGSAPSTPFTMRLEAEGSQLRGYVNGVLRITRADSQIGDSILAGLFINGPSSRFRNFEAGHIGSVKRQHRSHANMGLGHGFVEG